MIDSCEWNQPGHDAYTGTPRAAIMAYAQIPKHTRIALVARAEARDYDDVVMVDRDSIRGRQQYEAGITNMHFGSRGRLCGTVTRAGWSPEHVESAMVFCEQGWCVARFSVCNNWSVIRLAAGGRGPERPTAAGIAWPEFGAGAGAVVPADYVVPVLGMPVVEELRPDDRDIVFYPGPPEFMAFGYPPVPFAGTPPRVAVPPGAPPVVDTPPLVPPVPAIPEPSTWVLLAVGLAAIAMRARRAR